MSTSATSPPSGHGTNDDCLILFAHGARDARWSRTLEQLAAALAPRLPAVTISVAFLEFQSPSLPQALEAARARGAMRVDILPIFWASGGHVANDVPPLLDQWLTHHPQMRLRLLPVLSELPGMLDFIVAAATAQVHAGEAASSPSS